MTRVFALVALVLALATTSSFAALAGRQITLQLDCSRNSYSDLEALPAWKFNRLANGISNQVVVDGCGLSASTVGSIKAKAADRVVVTFNQKTDAQSFESCIVDGGHFRADRCDVVAVEPEKFEQCPMYSVSAVSTLYFDILDGGLDFSQLTGDEIELFMWKLGHKFSERCDIPLCSMGFFSGAYNVANFDEVEVSFESVSAYSAFEDCIVNQTRFKADQKAVIKGNHLP
eukprot:m.83044 g.83044  ORF g.83044 m.83044 type:complete len:230 (-) comp8682_c0_seq2:360-1049(-)